MKACTFVLALLFCLTAYAQDQLTVRINEQGLLKVMKMAIVQKTRAAKNRTISIPQKMYTFSIPKAKLVSNPIVSVLNEITDLNMTKDLPFYLNTTAIDILAEVDAKSLKAEILNSKKNGFDIKISINLPKVTVSAPRLSLCEDTSSKGSRCGSGLKADVTNLVIKTINKPVVITAVLRLRTDNDNARVSIVSVNSNLDSNVGPGLDIKKFGLTVPEVILTIEETKTVIENGIAREVVVKHNVPLDTSRLYSEIMKKKTFLSKKLLAFAGDFIAEDVAALVNSYLVKESVQTSWQIQQNDEKPTNNFLELYKPSFNNYTHMDNTYYRKPVTLYPTNLSANSPSSAAGGSEVVQKILQELMKVLKKSDLGIATQNVTTPNNKDLQIGASLNFKLGRERIFVRPYLANSNTRELPVINLQSRRASDLNLAISEPVMNGAFELISENGFLDRVLRDYGKMKGVYLAYNNKLRIHFTRRNSMVIVANMRVNLAEVDSKGIGGWFENVIGQILESRTTHGIINFPIQIEIVPSMYRANGKVMLNVYIKSPFEDNCGLGVMNVPKGCGEIMNEFGYPSNLNKLHSKVKNGVLAKLKESVGKALPRNEAIDVTPYLNQTLVEFVPTNITFDKEAYMILDLNINNIDFSKIK